MKDDILIIDNVIPEQTQVELEQLCLSVHFPWVYHQSGAYQPGTDLSSINPAFFKNSVDAPFFSHLLWNEYGRNSMFVDHFYPILDSIPFKIDQLKRLKLNLSLPNKKTTVDTHSVVHTDLDNDTYISGIYYVNNSDGDTVMFNELVGHTGELTVRQRITPQRGRLVLFNGNILHAGNTPIDCDTRVVLNLNVTERNA
jgi:hypothetical protein